MTRKIIGMIGGYLVMALIVFITFSIATNIQPL